MSGGLRTKIYSLACFCGFIPADPAHEDCSWANGRRIFSTSVEIAKIETGMVGAGVWGPCVSVWRVTAGLSWLPHQDHGLESSVSLRNSQSDLSVWLLFSCPTKIREMKNMWMHSLFQWNSVSRSGNLLYYRQALLRTGLNWSLELNWQQEPCFIMSCQKSEQHPAPYQGTVLLSQDLGHSPGDTCPQCCFYIVNSSFLGRFV